MGDFNDAAAEILAKLSTIDGLRVPKFGDATAAFPCALIGDPAQLTYDTSYKRGTDTYEDVELYVVIDRASDRRSRQEAHRYTAGSGAKSIKATLVPPWDSIQSLRLRRAEYVPDAKWERVPVMLIVFYMNVMMRGDT